LRSRHSLKAKNRERFGISAKAGGVNAVTGKVSVKSTGQPSRLLSSQMILASGDIVATSLGSQVEVLLNPALTCDSPKKRVCDG